MEDYERPPGRWLLSPIFSPDSLPCVVPGNCMVKVVPLPTLLRTSIFPLCWCTTLRTSDKPSPMLRPWRRLFVEKNGSNIFAISLFGMPQPVSEKTSLTQSVSSLLIAIVNLPPRGMASQAFTITFVITCCSCSGSPRIFRGFFPFFLTTVMFWRSMRLRTSVRLRSTIS
jgi:hypothetical protein